MFEHTPAHIGWIFLAAEIVSVALADVEKNRLIGCCRWHAWSNQCLDNSCSWFRVIII